MFIIYGVESRILATLSTLPQSPSNRNILKCSIKYDSKIASNTFRNYLFYYIELKHKHTRSHAHTLTQPPQWLGEGAGKDDGGQVRLTITEASDSVK